MACRDEAMAALAALRGQGSMSALTSAELGTTLIGQTRDLTGERVNNDDRGLIGGGQIGYNLQAGNIVFGIEATLSRTNLSDDFPSVFPGITFSTDVNWTGSVVGRLGFAHDRFLVYARGGWATANITLSGNNPGIPNPSLAMTNVTAGSSVAVLNTRSAAT